MAVAYIDFVPGRKGTLSQRLPWLDYYVSDIHGGCIVTDFDEQMTRYQGAAFSLQKVFSGSLRADEVEAAGFGRGLSSDSLNVENLLVLQGELTIERARIGRMLHVGDNFSNISNSTIVNRSTLTAALDSQAVRGGPEDLQVALEQVAAEVERSGNTNAAENFEGFTEELSRSEPRKSRLRAFWNELASALPAIEQLGSTTESIVGLFQ